MICLTVILIFILNIAVCISVRECISEQVCLNGVCQPTCKSNTSCPDFLFCQNGICLQEVRCSSHADCDESEQCILNNLGQVSNLFI